ncbi:conserved hypothetical protein, partial [Ixodes scapularis]
MCFGEKRFGCCLCPKAFGRELLLRAREESRTGGRPHRCVTCRERYVVQLGLVKSFTRVPGQQKFSICDPSFLRCMMISAGVKHTGNICVCCLACRNSFPHLV